MHVLDATGNLQLLPASVFCTERCTRTTEDTKEKIDKVLSKFKTISDQTTKQLADVIDYVEKIQNDLSNIPEENELSVAQSLMLSQCMKKVKDTSGKAAADHKELHGSVSKVGKAIDRNFTQDFGVVNKDETFCGLDQPDLVNQVICQHFFRQGMLDIGEALIREAGVDIADKSKEPFFEMNRILEALKNGDLQPALSWAYDNRQLLRDNHSSLQFKLQRLQFIQLLRGGPGKQAEMLAYARNFEPFATQHEKEIQQLMGSLLYVNSGVDNSPYAHLLQPIQWADICDVFTRDACALLGLSIESPLTLGINAGCKALPALLNIKQVMLQRQCTDVWSNKDELPVEVNLGAEYRFHSIFACPILRQQSTDSNPPMRLICGHIISRDALNKLANGNKVKCPYCPVEQSPTDAKVVYF
ncbi:PREDICTED: protein RMD5 homolog A-like [Priapulus caudatus]|uniref:Protein RMD5 homolog A-like n=1 Tax=Priapulus caudatus TaxID=37621 RepID=A0ABM1E1P2_PRICU|nr:PREDICTED: protein RMD5 homolog A-like [Priapulus caudatus]